MNNNNNNNNKHKPVPKEPATLIDLLNFIYTSKWESAEGLESGNGEDYYFRNDEGDEAYVNNDQGHLTVVMNGWTRYVTEDWNNKVDPKCEVC